MDCCLSVFAVAPRAGAWIEITDATACTAVCIVAPHAGAWVKDHKKRYEAVGLAS